MTLLNNTNIELCHPQHVTTVSDYHIACPFQIWALLKAGWSRGQYVQQVDLL